MTLNINSNTNTRASGQAFPSVLKDGNTIDFDYTKLITVDESDGVISLQDSYKGYIVEQQTESKRPLLTADGILADGISQFLKGAFTLVQPETIYFVGKQITWNDDDRFFDGNTALSGMLYQDQVSPSIRCYAGNTSAQYYNLALDQFAIITVHFNGANSWFRINNNAKITGNFGTANMGGLTLFARGTGLTDFFNGTCKRALIRQIVDTEDNDMDIYNYLVDQYYDSF